jgi:hypothetical protein
MPRAGRSAARRLHPGTANVVLTVTDALGLKATSASLSLVVAPGLHVRLVGLPAGTTVDTVARGATAQHVLALIGGLAVASNSLPAARVGVPYSASVKASGGVAPFTWKAAGLPVGLSISADGQISGTPKESGSASILLTVSDVYGLTATSAALSLEIAPAKGATTSSPTAAKLKASLLAQLRPKGKAAKIGALLRKRSYAMSFKALAAGTVAIDWYYQPKGAPRVLVAKGKRTFASAGTHSIAVKLTARGQKLLKHARRITLSVRGSFTARGARAISASRGFTLTR